MSNTILVIDTNRRFAGVVIPALAARGAAVRGLSQDANTADTVRAHGATEVAISDLRDHASIDRALESVTSVVQCKRLGNTIETPVLGRAQG